MTFVLAPTNLHWIDETTDPAKDMCAHGSVRFRIGEDVFADETKDCTVSAAALYLLRTLEEPLAGDPRREEALFPCCGFTMLDVNAPRACRQTGASLRAPSRAST